MATTDDKKPPNSRGWVSYKYLDTPEPTTRASEPTMQVPPGATARPPRDHHSSATTHTTKLYVGGRSSGEGDKVRQGTSFPPTSTSPRTRYFSAACYPLHHSSGYEYSLKP